MWAWQITHLPNKQTCVTQTFELRQALWYFILILSTYIYQSKNTLTECNGRNSMTHFDSDDTIGPVNLSVVVIHVTCPTSINPHLLICDSDMSPLLFHNMQQLCVINHNLIMTKYSRVFHLLNCICITVELNLSFISVFHIKHEDWHVCDES